MTTRRKFPFRGECGICGCGDARHREVDAWAGRVIAGDAPEDVADDYEVPVTWVEIAALAQGWRSGDDHPSTGVSGSQLERSGIHDE